jgi:hypothetical protein
MSYMLLILEPHNQRLDRGVEAGKKVYEQMQRFAEGLQKRGVLRSVESLARDTDAVRLQQQDGRLRLTDGPFTETKEMIGGFFLLDVATREEAVAIAAECPATQWCTVEVRQIGPCWE